MVVCTGCIHVAFDNMLALKLHHRAPSQHMQVWAAVGWGHEALSSLVDSQVAVSRVSNTTQTMPLQPKTKDIRSP